MTVLALDLDGVVITGHRDGGGRWAKNLEADLGVSPGQLRELFFKPHFGEIVCGRADLFEGLGAVWPSLGARCGVREFVDYWFAADSRLNEDL